MSVSDKILDTAEKLFNCRGYNAVGIDLIRDEAAVSKTTIYRYFSSKTELIIKVLRRRHGRFQDSLGAAVNASTTPKNQLQALLDWHFNWFTSADFEGCMFMHALSEFKKQENDVDKVALEHKQWLFEVIAHILSSEPHTAPVSQRAELVLTFIEGLIVRAEFGQITLTKERYHQELFRIAEL